MNCTINKIIIVSGTFLDKSCGFEADHYMIYTKHLVFIFFFFFGGEMKILELKKNKLAKIS